MKRRLPKLLILDYHGKARHLAAALATAGFPFAQTVTERFDVLLADIDAPWAFPEKHRIIADHAARGGKIIMYPHGANVLWEFDGVLPIETPFIQLVHGEGHKQVLESFGFPNPVEVIGWSYTDTVPFRSPDKVRRVLFAPAHPYAREHATPECQIDTNQAAFEEFIRLDCDKTVRYIGAAEANGLTTLDGYTHVQATAQLDYQDIDRADVVISCGTYAYMAVARGKPTVMLPSGFWDEANRDVALSEHWDDYKDLVRYPFVAGDAPLPDLIERACVGGPEIDEWKRLFVGGPFDRRRLFEIILYRQGVSNQ